MRLNKSIVSILLGTAIFSQVMAQSKEFDNLTFATIKAQTLSSSNINGSTNSNNRLQPGAILVYKTNSGRYGKLQIKEYGYNLILKWRTYTSTGATYSSGTNLTIRGTWHCDLDAGAEATPNCDFWWEQATSTARYLVPQNGATFKVQVRSYEDVDDQYSGYVSNEETRFVDYVWGFLSEFSGTTTWTQSQYLYGQCYMIGSSHLSYADVADIAYCAGHGSPASFKFDSNSTSCALSTMGWGSFSSSGRTGDLEYIIFHSCQVTSNDDANWRNNWKMQSSTDVKPFSGLHEALGFRTNHVNSSGSGAATADDFAENIEDGIDVRQAWYQAACDNRSHTTLNRPCVFYVRPHQTETIAHHNSMDYRYGDSDYMIDSYYLAD